jgi:mono/diheme cytochrome c family protein
VNVRPPSGALLGVGLLLIASIARAQQPAPTQPDTNAITDAMVDLGRAVFHGKGTCFMCHGPQLEGSQIAPTLKAHAWRDAKNGQFDEIFRVVTHGVPSTVMVAFPGGISRTDALSVAAYVWSVNNRKVKP